MKRLYEPHHTMRVAIFMSGTGSNATRILEAQKGFEVVLIFTDRDCNAEKIAQEFHVKYYKNDINAYYKKRNAKRSDLTVRKDYDQETATILEKEKIDVVALCGYNSIITNTIFSRWITVNVHPADLSLLQDGKRILAGCMGANCITKARELGHTSVRATTHLVEEGVDEGGILMLSENVAITESDEETLEELKKKGDHVIYHETLKRLARGSFWKSEGIIIDGSEEKKIIRQHLIPLRNKLATSEKSDAIQNKLLEEDAITNAETIMLYSSTGSEVDTSNLRKLLAKKTLALPTTRDGKIEAHAIDDQPLTPGAYGILEAKGEVVEPQNIDVIIVPGIAFDTAGNRIGYGLGYYDAFLKKTNAVRIALCYDEQIVDKIWPDVYDEKVSIIITDKQRIEVGA